MQYDFDEIIERKGTKTFKWDFLKEIFGDSELTSMWVADMDFKAPQPVIDAVVERAEHGIYGYTGKEDSFFNAIINWMRERHGVETEKNWYVPTPGVVNAVAVLVNTFSQPGDEVIVQTPVYYPFFSVVESNGRRLIKNPLKLEGNRYTMDLEDFENRITPRTRLFIMSNPHNPVGRVWGEEELRRLGEICKKHGIIIISDEIHCDLVFNGNKHYSYLNLKEFYSNAIVCVAPSKTFNLAGFATSTMIIPDEWLRNRVKDTMDMWHINMLNLFGIIAFEAAYTYGGEWYDQMKEYVWGNYEFMVDYINTHIPDIDVFPLEGTYLVWVDFRKLGLTHDQINDICLKGAKLALDQGMMFGEEGRGFQRFNIACPRSVLKTALVKLEKEIKNLM
ncbi:MAG TPA: MalY/PatB family protein [Thermotogota bacterium]|nr:MalY/PatB family protein [Thermotogota bacterium]HPJ89438.1 MalY/PatB family protein [Thermotogota bacterium]HPR95263.1 MalY/PatB family protein [Thermotogota bacterium]